MILHGFRAGSPVVTNTGCCLSARRVPTPTLGATIRIGCMPQPVCLSRTGDDLPHSDPSERIPPAPDLPCSAG
jgi:hypothetical protein